jgi:hypothetical protein
MIKSELSPCQYGFALQHFLHTIIWLHKLYPTTPILLSTFDFKSAYRRVHWLVEHGSPAVPLVWSTLFLALWHNTSPLSTMSYSP